MHLYRFRLYDSKVKLYIMINKKTIYGTLDHMK